MSKWVKQGRIFNLEPAGYRTTHCQVPTPYVMADRVRLYYAGRDTAGRSYPAYVDLDRRDLSSVLGYRDRPVMPHGAPGTFDSDGIMPGTIVEQGSELWMYYTGWNEKSRTARYHNAVGLAVSRDGGKTFLQKHQGPVVDRTKDLPGLAVTPFVLRDNWWRMWYISGVNWKKVGDKYEPVYVIRYAESMNGQDWKLEHDVCVAPQGEAEAFSNPSVIREDDMYRMWYCYRGSEDYRDGKNAYRIGYAYSRNGKNFIRADEQGGLDVSADPSAFDSTMTCYPYVIDLDGRRVMFYNGNGFGQSGIGYAVWEE